MIKRIILLLVLATYSSSKAQFIKERAVNISLGLGISLPYNEEDLSGQGFYAEGEYIMTVSSWLQIRPYAGFIYTDTFTDDLSPAQSGFELSTSAFFTGGKLRVIAPIPWVSPYVEGGVGLSIGSFENRTFEYDFKKSGIFHHYPVSIGVLLGRNRDVDVAFKYLIHPSAKQVIGAAAIGISFPVN
jgi:hypothetical protein